MKAHNHLYSYKNK
jgi:uncharacterized membrane protein YdbT with pleckstrin-like domain